MIHALIADDDEALRSLVSQVLEADGYTVDVAKDGESAWKLFVSAAFVTVAVTATYKDK